MLPPSKEYSKPAERIISKVVEENKFSATDNATTTTTYANMVINNGIKRVL